MMQIRNSQKSAVPREAALIRQTDGSIALSRSLSDRPYDVLYDVLGAREEKKV
jgi:hypothetical protein